MASIFLAGDWRNQALDTVAMALQQEGHNVVDPRRLTTQFESAGTALTVGQLAAAIPWQTDHREQITACDWLLLVTPSGKDAHADYGYAVAQGLQTAVFMTGPTRPKAVYAWASEAFDSLVGLLRALDGADAIEQRGDVEDLRDRLPGRRPTPEYVQAPPLPEYAAELVGQAYEPPPVVTPLIPHGRLEALAKLAGGQPPLELPREPQLATPEQLAAELASSVSVRARQAPIGTIEPSPPSPPMYWNPATTREVQQGEVYVERGLRRR